MIQTETGTKFYYVDRAFDSAHAQATRVFDSLRAKGKGCSLYERNLNPGATWVLLKEFTGDASSTTTTPPNKNMTNNLTPTDLQITRRVLAAARQQLESEQDVLARSATTILIDNCGIIIDEVQAIFNQIKKLREEIELIEQVAKLEVLDEKINPAVDSFHVRSF